MKTPSISLKVRRGLIVTTLAVQALVMAAGWALAFSETRSSLARTIQDRLIEDKVALADQCGRMLIRTGVRDLQFGTTDWDRIQSLLEDLQLPAEAFVCLVDPAGQILCHPQLRVNPALRQITLGQKRLAMLGLDATVPLDGIAPGGTLAGTMDFIGGTHLVVARHIPELDATLLVYQPESGLTAIGSGAAAGMVIGAGTAGVAVLGLTLLATLLLLHRHDRVVSEVNRGLERDVDQRVQQLLATRHALIFGLAKLADYRDTDTGSHLDRICTYSVMLAEELRAREPEITDEWIDRLRLAASLHDIGKVGIPDSILLKPGRLTPEERAVMEKHAVIGADTLLAIRRRLGEDALVEMGVQIALQHHERWDGTGYPNRLRETQIALAARIVALADFYDAVTSKRVYKDAMTHEEARDLVRQGRAAHFDPAVADAFEALQANFDETRRRLQTPAPAADWPRRAAA